MIGDEHNYHYISFKRANNFYHTAFKLSAIGFTHTNTTTTINPVPESTD